MKNDAAMRRNEMAAVTRGCPAAFSSGEKFSNVNHPQKWRWATLPIMNDSLTSVGLGPPTAATAIRADSGLNVYPSRKDRVLEGTKK
jgi:hypothetical protein